MLTLEVLKKLKPAFEDNRDLTNSFITTIEGCMQKGWLLNKERLSIIGMLSKLNQRKVIDLKTLSTLEMSLKSETIEVRGFQVVNGDFQVEILGEDDKDLGFITVTSEELKKYYEEEDYSINFYELTQNHRPETIDLIQDYLNE